MTDIITRGYAADIIYKDEKERMVYAIATGPKMDLDGQGCDPDWLRSAVPTWMQRGNVRLMHNAELPPVGKAKRAVETPENEWAIAVKVVDNDTWTLIDEGLITGMSIGAKNATVVQDPRFPHGLIKGGDLVEMSFVDYPAYQYSTISKDKPSLFKSKSGREIQVDASRFSFFKVSAAGSPVYNGVVVEGDTVKVAGGLELPGVVRDNLERARQKTEEIKHKAEHTPTGQWHNPYDGTPMMVVPGKSAPADFTKAGVAKLTGSREAATPPAAVVAPAPIKEKAKTKLPATYKIAPSREHGLVVKYLDSMTGENDAVVLPIESYMAEPYGNAVDGSAITLTGTEAKHNPAINAVLAGLKTLAIQELQEDELEFDCVVELAMIARCFLDWVYGEQMEAENEAYEEAMAQFLAMSAEPDKTKRHEMAKAISNLLTKLSAITKEAAVVAETETEKAEAATDAEKAAKGSAGNSPDGKPAAGDAATGDESPEDDEGDNAKGQGKGKAGAKAADPEVEKVGKTISRATADRLMSLADTPGVPTSVQAGLKELAGFVLDGLPTNEPAGAAPELHDGETDARLPRETIDWTSPFGQISAEVSAAFVTPTGKDAKADIQKMAAPDVAKAFVGGLQKLATDAAVTAIESFVTSDSFIKRLADAATASVAAAKASDDAKVAIEKVAEVSETVKTEVEKVRKEFGDEFTRIKGLPQPAKGVSAEALVSQKDFVANPGETKAAEPAVTSATAYLGESIMKRAMAGDVQAQRILREAIETGGVTPKGQDDAAKAAITEAWKHPARP